MLEVILGDLHLFWPVKSDGPKCPGMCRMIYGRGSNGKPASLISLVLTNSSPEANRGFIKSREHQGNSFQHPRKIQDIQTARHAYPKCLYVMTGLDLLRCPEVYP